MKKQLIIENLIKAIMNGDNKAADRFLNLYVQRRLAAVTKRAYENEKLV